MPERIKVAQYHGRPLEELELPDGTVLKLRQPLEADYYRITETMEAHRKRVETFAKDLVERAQAKAETAKAEGEDGDAEGRDLIEQEGDEARLPLVVTERYQRASVVAIFIEPEQTPGAILDTLGPDIIHFLFLRVMEVIGGGAAKKRLAATSPVTT